MRIALFLGSFNPVHVGHLQISTYVLDMQLVDLVLWIVSPQNPTKSREILLPVEERLQLSRIALNNHSNIVVSDIETNLPTPSLSITTIKEVVIQHPNDSLFLLLGYDNFVTFNSWSAYEEILSLCTLLVYPRNMSEAPHFEQIPWHHKSIFLEGAPKMDISATELRSLVASQKPFGHLVPKSVEKAIINKRLFLPPKTDK